MVKNGRAMRDTYERPRRQREGFVASASFCFSVRISSKRFVTSRMIAANPVSSPAPSRSGTIVKLDGDSGTVVFDPWNREDVAMTITALATLDDVVVAVPMALSQPFRDDDVQGLTDGSIPRIAENALRSRIPETNNALLVRSDNRIGTRGKNGFGECVRKAHDWISQEHVATRMMLKRCRG
jgi:hypothetical protein